MPPTVIRRAAWFRCELAKGEIDVYAEEVAGSIPVPYTQVKGHFPTSGSGLSAVYSDGQRASRPRNAIDASELLGQSGGRTAVLLCRP